MENKANCATMQISGRKKRQSSDRDRITYNKVFWLFLLGSVLGFFIEGVFCLVRKGHWETHVVSIVGPFNILYGFGAVLFYIGAGTLKSRPLAVRVILLMLTATMLELLCGLLLRYGLGMRAWNYDNSFLNYKGLICIGFSLTWGLAAFAFCILHPRLSLCLNKFNGKRLRFAAIILSMFMIINLSLTGAAIFRWSARHYGVEAKTKIGRSIDNKMSNEWMQSRFVEWEFLDDK